MGKLILVRHGETDKNVNNTLHGRNDPEILNEVGVKQIEQVAKSLIKFSPSKIYSSKERRAIKSAEILAKALSVPIQIIDGMEERNWGIFTGKPWEEIQKTLDPMSFDERYNYIPPQGESWNVFESRLIEALNKIIEENKEKTIVIITHGGAIRALMPFLLNVPREESFKYDLDNGSLTIFDFNDQQFHKIVVNDTSHLTK